MASYRVFFIEGMSKKRIAALTIALTCMTAAFLAAPAALAYRAARVSADQADVKDSPDPSSATNATLTQGTRVNTSDRAVNGFYRVRAADSMGWLPASDLDFGGGAPPPPAASSSQNVRPETMGDQTSFEQPSSSAHPWAVKAFAGMDYFSPTDINNVVGSTGMNGGTGLGGQIQYGLNSSLSLALRVEHLSKTATGQASGGTGDTIQLAVGSTPVMLGVDWMATKGENLSLDFGFFAGEGLSTQISATDQSASAPNVTTISASAPTALLDADLNWMVSEPVWLFTELGYRYLKTSATAPSVTSPGNLLETNGVNNPLVIDLSGLVINFGLRINF